MNSYTIIVIIALALGTLLPRWGIFLTPYTGLFLQIIFFLSALKISRTVFHDIKKELGLLLRANLYMLIVLPLGFLYLNFCHPREERVSAISPFAFR